MEEYPSDDNDEMLIVEGFHQRNGSGRRSLHHKEETHPEAQYGVYLGPLYTRKLSAATGVEEPFARGRAIMCITRDTARNRTSPSAGTPRCKVGMNAQTDAGSRADAQTAAQQL